MIKPIPGADPDIINYYVKKGYRGIIIEAFGLGQVASDQWVKDKKMSWTSVIRKVSKKVPVFFAAQTVYGRLNPNVYSEAREAQAAGAVFLEDMLSEVAVIKLGWVLGHTKEMEKVKEMMVTNLAGEITERSEI